MLRNAVGGGRVSDFPKKKRYEDVPFNVICVTTGWVRGLYITLEWPLISDPQVSSSSTPNSPFLG